MGSVYYISPEQAQEHELHETSDLYSLGVVLYQMLTGKLPYTGESPVTVALKHVGDPVPTIDVRETGVSPALAAIVNRLLQKKPRASLSVGERARNRAARGARTSERRRISHRRRRARPRLIAAGATAAALADAGSLVPPQDEDEREPVAHRGSSLGSLRRCWPQP